MSIKMETGGGGDTKQHLVKGLKLAESLRHGRKGGGVFVHAVHANGQCLHPAPPSDGDFGHYTVLPALDKSRRQFHFISINK